MDCLRQKSADELIKGADEHQLFNGGTQEHPNHKWSPSIVVDGMFLPEEPLELYKTGKTSNMPHMTGVTSDEGFVFAQYFIDAFEGNVDKMRNTSIGEVEFKTFLEEILKKLSQGNTKMAANAAAEFYSVNGTFGLKALTTAVGDFMFAAHARRQAEYCAGEYSDFLLHFLFFFFLLFSFHSSSSSSSLPSSSSDPFCFSLSYYSNLFSPFSSSSRLFHHHHHFIDFLSFLFLTCQTVQGY